MRHSDGEATLELRIGTPEENILLAISKMAKYGGKLTLLDMMWEPFSSEERAVDRSLLCAETDALLNECETKSNNVFYRYSHSYTVVDKSANVFSIESAGASSGHRLKDDFTHFYSVSCGVGFCDLKKWGITEGEQGVLLDTLDVRSKKFIETAASGPIKILKRKQRNNLEHILTQILSFSRKCRSSSIKYTSTYI